MTRNKNEQQQGDIINAEL